MRIEAIRGHCLNKNGVTEEFPFDDTTLVFKVMGKIFALINLEGDSHLNLKCEPNLALELRASYPENVLPGWHMNKKHWNTIVIEHNLDKDLIFEWVDHSYEQVKSKLTKKLKDELDAMQSI
ncbi:MmcQ/YjbR family DNA-binding protein [Bacteroidota bacterium]